MSHQTPPPQHSYPSQSPAQPATPAPPATPSYAPPAASPLVGPPSVGYGTPTPRVAPPTTLGQTNTFAVVAIILAFFQPIAAIIFGHMALSQIKRNGDAGRGLALTAVIIGYVAAAFVIIFAFVYVGIIVAAIASIPYYA